MLLRSRPYIRIIPRRLILSILHLFRRFCIFQCSGCQDIRGLERTGFEDRGLELVCERDVLYHSWAREQDSQALFHSLQFVASPMRCLCLLKLFSNFKTNRVLRSACVVSTCNNSLGCPTYKAYVMLDLLSPHETAPEPEIFHPSRQPSSPKENRLDS